jgi:hypothetical protein
MASNLSTETGQIRDWRSIVTLIVFVLASELPATILEYVSVTANSCCL